MDIEDLEMHDMTKERQKEEREEEEEETNLDWDGYDNSLDNFDNNTSHYDSDLPSTSYERPELDKNIALKTSSTQKGRRSVKVQRCQSLWERSGTVQSTPRRNDGVRGGQK